MQLEWKLVSWNHIGFFLSLTSSHFFPLPHWSSIFQPLLWSPFPQWLAEVYRSQGLLVQGVMAYRQSLHLASQLGVHNSQVASLLRLALLALVPCMVSSWIAMGNEKKIKVWLFLVLTLCDMLSQAGVPGNEWTDLLLEATTEVLKLASSAVALLFQALLQYVTKMAARSGSNFFGFFCSTEYTFTFRMLQTWNFFYVIKWFIFQVC